MVSLYPKILEVMFMKFISTLHNKNINEIPVADPGVWLVLHVSSPLSSVKFLVLLLNSLSTECDIFVCKYVWHKYSRQMVLL